MGDTLWVRELRGLSVHLQRGSERRVQGSRVTSDAGLILVRELDERLGLEGIISTHLSDFRHGLNTQFRLPDLLRQSVYSLKPLVRDKAFPLPGRQLDHGAIDRGESRTPRRRSVPARWLHRDESFAHQSRRRAVLQQAGHGRAMDQGGEASGTLHATVVSPVPPNEVRSQRSVVAYNLGNLWRPLVLPRASITGR
jgi:hypothetical protein